MAVYFEYKNMSFEKVEGIWIHKDWALPGDFGDIHDKPASQDLQEKVELAYKLDLLEKKLLKGGIQNTPPKEKESQPKVRTKKIQPDLDLTKTKEENGIQDSPKKFVKKTSMIGSFNPFVKSAE